MNERTPLWTEYVRKSSFKPLTRWVPSDPTSLAAFLPPNNRINSKMDYSVGGPLWLEWQRLQTHSEWERWKEMYSEKQPLNKFRIFYDWLLENDFPVEAECVLNECIDFHRYEPNARYYTPPFESVNESSDPEPVEGAA